MDKTKNCLTHQHKNMSSQSTHDMDVFYKNIMNILERRQLNEKKPTDALTYVFCCNNILEARDIVSDATNVIRNNIANQFSDKFKISYRFSFVPNSPIIAYPAKKRDKYTPYVVLCYFDLTYIKKEDK